MTNTAALSEHSKMSKEFYTNRYHFQVQLYGKFMTLLKTVKHMSHLNSVITLLITRTILIEQYKYLKIAKVFSENQAPIYIHVHVRSTLLKKEKHT